MAIMSCALCTRRFICMIGWRFLSPRAAAPLKLNAMIPLSPPVEKTLSTALLNSGVAPGNMRAESGFDGGRGYLPEADLVEPVPTQRPRLWASRDLKVARIYLFGHAWWPGLDPMSLCFYGEVAHWVLGVARKSIRSWSFRAGIA